MASYTVTLRLMEPRGLLAVLPDGTSSADVEVIRRNLVYLSYAYAILGDLYA